jgi:hypothetical protein
LTRMKSQGHAVLIFLKLCCNANDKHDPKTRPRRKGVGVTCRSSGALKLTAPGRYCLWVDIDVMRETYIE